MIKKIFLIFNFIRLRWISLSATFLIFSLRSLLDNSAFSQAGEWVWIKGDSIPDQLGNYGVQGVSGPLNNPPSLYEPCEWTDLNGNFWLFGGLFGMGSAKVCYSDLWKYDPIVNEWTWIKGNAIPGDTGNYGIQGVASVTNLPPSRSWGVATWTDLNGDFWLYGGASPIAGNPNINCGRSDLWKYNIASNTWTWMHGSSSCNESPVYGIIGIPSPLNTPGSRVETSATWVDDTNNLWLFSGRQGNDLWKYTISANEWVMLKGDTLGYQPGVYGTKGIADPLNVPGGRMAYGTWKDVNGKFWLFAGHDIYYGFYFNDMWMYDPISNNWTWMSGTNLPNQNAISGSFCSDSPGYVPASRFENRARWRDACGRFWMYGGSHTNDLWYFDPVSLEWSLVNGDPTNLFFHSPVYGIMGVPSAFNQPGSRSGSVGWISNDGALYHFGGAEVLNKRNDLWKFIPDTSCGGCNLQTSVNKNNPPKADELLVFPNPANTSLTISFSSSAKQTLELRIYNTLGKQIYVEKEEITKGKFEKEINVKKLSGGIYFLQVKTKEGNINSKVIISH